MYESRTGQVSRTGLVETDLALLTYAHYEQIQPTKLCFHSGAVIGNLVKRNGSVRNEDILRSYVYMVAKFLAQYEITGVLGFCRYRIEFVDGIDPYVLEGYLTLVISPSQVLIQGDRGGAGGKTELEQLSWMQLVERVYLSDDFVAYLLTRLERSLADFCINLFPAVENVFRKTFLN